MASKVGTSRMPNSSFPRIIRKKSGRNQILFQHPSTSQNKRSEDPPITITAQSIQPCVLINKSSNRKLTEETQELEPLNSPTAKSILSVHLKFCRERRGEELELKEKKQHSSVHLRFRRTEGVNLL
ncbi:hypothetical protein Dimus_006332 [Dionaea muscipula]